MRKNEITREIDKKIKSIEKMDFITDAEKVFTIHGLEIAKETIRDFKRR